MTKGFSGFDDEDSTITGTLKATDLEGLTDGTVFSIASADTPVNGTTSIDPATGAWTYTPNDNFNGKDSFTVTITDNLGGITIQVISLKIYPIDDAPVVSGSFTGSVTEESGTNTATGSLSIADVDGGDSPSFADVPATPGNNGYGSFALNK
ncbi:hypothetical protein SynWH8101_2494 [Synechococcus sp. WH 8101]|uniref:Ig-like domain-containing protein n=1 Tax=Synechococcus sp. WH 8101 TaxID=59932 RepID=UPI001022EA8A|nr:Ig-like domain-containing protein [Synechococcus sp. WH 8101]QBE70066.1 hypothetical protein SynWH8101_2494 [Synechococcus sp. WH 8101]QNI46332.1 cadherin domain protein [Synechococcus sp. WH 8101]